MALSGAGLVLFILGHIAGNLQVFMGQEALNAYAKFLKESGILWPARIGLLAIVGSHFVMAFRLRLGNAKARPQSYKYEHTVKASVASRYMMQTGIVIFIFVVLHLLHFTMGKLQPEFYHLVDSKGRHDVYSMLVHGFQNPAYSLLYVVCMLALGFHLSHALSSAFQSLGFYHSKYTPKIKMAAPVLAWGIAFAYISIPVSVMLGVVTLP